MNVMRGIDDDCGKIIAAAQAVVMAARKCRAALAMGSTANARVAIEELDAEATKLAEAVGTLADTTDHWGEPA